MMAVQLMHAHIHAQAAIKVATDGFSWVFADHHQVQDVARIAAEDVARLQGQLADLDHKNRMQASVPEASRDAKTPPGGAWIEKAHLI